MRSEVSWKGYYVNLPAAHGSSGTNARMITVFTMVRLHALLPMNLHYSQCCATCQRYPEALVQDKISPTALRVSHIHKASMVNRDLIHSPGLGLRCTWHLSGITAKMFSRGLLIQDLLQTAISGIGKVVVAGGLGRWDSRPIERVRFDSHSCS